LGLALMECVPSSLMHSPFLFCVYPIVWISVLTMPRAVVITNPEDPRFDLEKLVAKWEKETQ
jgi:hypothetical protein